MRVAITQKIDTIGAARRDIKSLITKITVLDFLSSCISFANKNITDIFLTVTYSFDKPNHVSFKKICVNKGKNIFY